MKDGLPLADAVNLAMTFHFTLLPPRECSPNSRVHWSIRHRAVREWLAVARVDLHRQLPKGTTLPLPFPVRATSTVYIGAGTYRRMDADNLLARMKPLFDLLVVEGILRDDRAEWFRPEVPTIIRVWQKREYELELVLAQGEQWRLP